MKFTGIHNVRVHIIIETGFSEFSGAVKEFTNTETGNVSGQMKRIGSPVVVRTEDTFFISSSEKLSIRSEGKERLTCDLSVHSRRLSVRAGSWE